MEKVLGRLKEGKTAGVEGITNEVWKLGGRELAGLLVNAKLKVVCQNW